MKSIALLNIGPAASVSMVTEPAATVGTEAPTGPPGFDPIPSTLICRAVWSVPAQLKKNAAQSACLALAATPYVSGADMAAYPPPASAGGNRKNPTFPGMAVS